MFECRACCKCFVDLDMRRMHEASCGTRCGRCEKNFMYPGGLANHECVKVSCKKCRVYVADETDLLNHICGNRSDIRSGDGMKRMMRATTTSNDVGESRDEARNDAFHCRVCDVHIPKRYKGAHYKSLAHKQKTVTSTDSIDVVTVESAFGARIATYRIYNSARAFVTVDEFMASIKDTAMQLLRDKARELTAMKVNFELFAYYIRGGLTDNDVVGDIKSFNTRLEVINESSDMSAFFDRNASTIRTKGEEFQERDSGWMLKKMLFLEININQHRPIKY